MNVVVTNSTLFDRHHIGSETGSAVLADALAVLDEAPVDLDGLAEEVGAVESFDGVGRLLLRLVLDDGVALEVAGTAVQIQMHVLHVSVLLNNRLKF